MTHDLLRDALRVPVPDALRSANPRTQRQLVLQRKAQKRLKDRQFFKRMKAREKARRSEFLTRSAYHKSSGGVCG